VNSIAFGFTNGTLGFDLKTGYFPINGAGLYIKRIIVKLNIGREDKF
jgi:hypothetical protein